MFTSQQFRFGECCGIDQIHVDIDWLNELLWPSEGSELSGILQDRFEVPESAVYDEAFMRAFIDGALSFFEEIRDKV